MASCRRLAILLLTALLLIGLSEDTEGMECKRDELFCMMDEEETCVEADWVCDDFPDCDDGEDEEPALCQSQEEVITTTTTTTTTTTVSPYYDEDYYDYYDTGDDRSEEKQEEPEKEVVPEGPPEIPEMCSLHTCNSAQQWSYDTSRVYYYRYAVDASTTVLGTSDRQANFRLLADVRIEVLTYCEMELKLSHVEMIGSKSDGGQITITEHQFINNLNSNSLRFSLNKGLVETVCPRSNETLESLNVKRGILSLLQNTMPRFDLQHDTRENDVLGTCNVRYSFGGTDNTKFIINKVKDLDSCSNKMAVSSSVRSVPYAFIGGVESTPLLQRRSECQQTVSEKRLDSVECTERHRLVPFSGGEDGGVETVLKQSLKHSYTSFFSAKIGSIARRTDLEYEHYDDSGAGVPPTGDATALEDDSDESNDSAEAKDEANMERVTDVMQTIAEHLRSSRSSVARPSDFGALVTSLRYLDLQQLTELAGHDDKDKSWLVFEDALSSVGTASSVGLIRQLLNSRPNHDRAQQWLQSLAYIPRPDQETLRAALGLLSMTGVPRQAFLGVGAVVSAYCIHHPACQTHEPVRQTMDALHNFIMGSCVRTTSAEKIQTLMAIKGVGNAGAAATKATVDLLHQCMMEGSNENEIRVAAINAFRHFPCNLTNPLGDILKNVEEDSELRIAAYLGVMRCADYDTLVLVNTLLEHEEVNQVGSFIWTHLSNIQEGALPSHITLQGLLSNVELQEKFRTDIRKFSRNYEWSAFYDPLNVGASLEGNLIFSQRSYIPRSASLNFTTDLFGQSINWLELEARMEGLERPLESLFMGGVPPPVSPAGGINDVSIRTLIDRTGTGKAYRSKDPELSLSVRSFGNDVHYQHLHGAQPIMDMFSKLDPREYIQRLNRGETISLQKSSRVIESSGVVATSAGLPVTVAVTATLSLDVWAKASIQLGSTLPSHFSPSVDIRGTLTPSVSSELQASVTINGVAVMAGVEVEASLSSSSVIEGRIAGSSLSTFNLDINMPTDKMELINVTSRLVLLHGSASSPDDSSLTIDKEELESEDSDVMATEDCTIYTDEIGAQLCWSALYPNTSTVHNSPDFPLTGSAHLKILLIKKDPALSNYQLRYNLIKSPVESSVLISANTPDTSRDREHSLMLSINRQRHTAAFRLHTPTSHYDAMGRYLWSDMVKSLDMSIHLNRALAAEVELSLVSHEKSSKGFYKPTAKIKWKGTEVFSLDGEIEANEKTSSIVYKLDLEFAVHTLDANTPSNIAGTVSGELTADRTKRDIALLINYNIGDERHNMTVNYNVDTAMVNSDWKFVSNCRGVFSQFPSLNFLTENSYRIKPGEGKMDVMFSFGEPYLDPDNAVHFHRSITLLHSDDRTFINSTLALRHNARNIDMKISGDASTDWSHVLNTGFTFQLWPNRALSSRINLQKTSSHLLDALGTFQLRVPTWPDVNLRATVNETVRRQFQLYAFGSAGPDRFVESKGTYHVDPLMGHKLLLAVRLPDRGTTTVNVTALFTWKHAFTIVEVTPENGFTYRGVVDYSEAPVTTLGASSRSLHLELHLPNKIIKSTTDMSVGNVVLISNRLQIDRSQDILTWLTLDVLKEKQRGLHFKVQWDPNRNPQKKVEMRIQRQWSDPTRSSLEASAFLGMMSHTYQMRWDSSALTKYGTRTMSLEWVQSHMASIIWEEVFTGERQEVKGSAVMSFTRSDTADFTAVLQLTTPFENWEDNILKIGYLRSHDQVKALLESHWHDGEFLNADATLRKNFESIGHFEASSTLDISSSFRGMTSLKTAAQIKKRSGLLESSAFIEWEDDRLELLLEGHDKSMPGQLEYSMFGQAITSLEGYRSLAAELNLLASSNNVNAKAAAHWDAINYEIKCRGHRFSGDDYLNGEMSLLLPGYEEEDFYGHLRIYLDRLDNKHKLLAIGKWSGKELKVEGHVTSSRQDFHGSLSITTPFEAFPRASLVLGKGFDGINHKSEAQLTWGRNFVAGFEMKLHLTSLVDFLVSVSINTPFQRFKEVKAELLNLFLIEERTVRCHSRVFGQIGEKRYGIGARYEQGQKPRIRVAFEVYTPIPNLELLSLDMSDNSANHDSEYDLMVLYSSNKPLHLTVLVVRGEDEEDWAVVANLPFSILNSELHDAKLTVNTGLGWGAVPRLTLSLNADTGKVRKLFLHMQLPPYEMGSFEASLGGVITTIPGYEEMTLRADFLLPYYEEYGTLDASLRTLGAGTTAVTMKGNYRSFSAAFTSPIEPFRTGEVKWHMTPLDVVRETVTGSFKWETGEIQLDGTAHVRDGYINRLEAQVRTPWSAMHTAELTLDNEKTYNGYSSHIQLNGDDMTYVVNIVTTMQDHQGWNINAKLERTSGSSSSEYSSDVTWQFDDEKLLLAVDVNTPHQGDHALSGKIDIEFMLPSYISVVTWDTPLGAGRLETDMERNTMSRSIVWTSTLTLPQPRYDPNTYTLKVTLDNRSTDYKVDLDLGVSLTSNHEDWGMMKVEGSLTQVTSEPGEVRLSLTWPNLPPVTFRGEVSHQNNYSIIRPKVTLEVSNTRYIIDGEMRRVSDTQLILRGAAVKNTPGQPPVEFRVESDFSYPTNQVDGSVTVRLPQGSRWNTIKASFTHRKVNEEHKYSVRLLTDEHVTLLEGTLSNPAPGEVEGSVSIESTLRWNNHPLRLSFSQSLTDETYAGEYTLDFPRHNQQTDTWTRGVVKASLRHSFLEFGHKGFLTVHPAFVKLDPIRIDYNFEFPNSLDMLVQVHISYKAIKAGVKVEEITVVMPNGERKTRFGVELDNPLWPFGITKYKTSTPDGKHETLIEVYDLVRPSRKVSLSFSSNNQDQGHMFAIKTVLPAGREVSLTTGYHFSATKVELMFNFKWMEEQEIDVAFKWNDVSQMNEKKHHLEAWFVHPFRAVVAEANYRRIGATVNADLSFNWNKHNPLTDVLQSTLQWQDLSYSAAEHYKGLLTVIHPSLPTNVVIGLELQRGQTYPLLAALKVHYSPDHSRDLSLNLNVTRLTHEQHYRKHFLTKVMASHPHTNLILEGVSNVMMGDGVYSYEHSLAYSNSTGHQFESHVEAALDLHEKVLRAKVFGHDKELDVSLVVVKEGAGRWRIKALSAPDEEFPISSVVEIHPHQSVFTVTLHNAAAGQDTQHYPNLNVKKVTVKGGIEDMRNAIFSLSHIQTVTEMPDYDYNYDDDVDDGDDVMVAQPLNVTEFLVSDIDFFFRLNHTRLLASRLLWRPNFREELAMELSQLAGVGHVYRNDLKEWLKEALRLVGAEAVARSKPIIRDLATIATPLASHFRNQSREFVADLKKVYTKFNLTEQEMQLKASLTFIFKKFGETLRKTRVYKWVQNKLAEGTLRRKIIAIIDRLKTIYRNAVSGSGDGGLRGKLQRIKAALAATHDKLVKRWYLKLRQVLDDFRSRIRTWLRSRWHAVYNDYKPHIITTLDSIEMTLNQMVNTVSGWVRNVRESIATSSYYEFISDRISRVKEFIDSMLRRSLKENLEMAFDCVESVVYKAVQFVLREVTPFLKDVLDGLREALRILEQYPLVRQLKRRVVAMVETVVWSVGQIKFRQQFINTVAFVVENGYTIVTQTALDAEHRHRKEKTTLFLDSEAGLLEFTQKLPVNWLYFNQQPKWEELQEWRYFTTLKNVLAGGSNINVLRYWYKNFNLRPDPSTWLPPFRGSSKVVGQQHLVSWNGRLLEYKGVCRYLLAADLVSKRWAVVLNYHANAPNAYHIYIDGAQIEMAQDFTVKINGQDSKLPVVLRTAVVYRSSRSGEELILQQDSGLVIKWNQLHDVFSITLDGIYFGKVGGLLGTNNYEHLDDNLTPNGYRALDTMELAASWRVSRSGCQTSRNTAVRRTGAASERCRQLFAGEESPFKYCFYQVSPLAYSSICDVLPRASSANERLKASCAAASAFRHTCDVAGVPTKIPHDCSVCKYERADGTEGTVPESQTVSIPVDEIPSSTDVVLIIEAGRCNSERNIRRNLRRFFQVFDAELARNGVEGSRYTVVSYGGRGFFASPQLVLSGKELFVSANRLNSVLANVQFDTTPGTSGSAFAFEALRFSSNLPFRAGVSPTFIMMPCSPCMPDVGWLDFSTMYHILIDRSAVLHILTPAELVVSKQSLTNRLFGMDKNKVYTVRDSTTPFLRGDESLRRHVAAPRAQLEYCSPLALQTNGSIFSSRWLNLRRRKKIEQLAVVLGRRVAETALPRHDQRCICLPTTGDSVKMKCHRQRPDWGNYSVMAPYFDEEGEEVFRDTVTGFGYQALAL